MKFIKSTAAIALISTMPLLSTQINAQEIESNGLTRAENLKLAKKFQKEFINTAKRINPKNIDASEYENHYNGTIGTIDASKDPWKPLTQQEMDDNIEETFYKLDKYSISIFVDYDLDGKPDVASIYNNSKQGAVIVTYASSGRSEVIYKSDDPMKGGPQIFPVGKNHIMLNFPETNQLILGKINGKPMVHYMGR